MPSGGQAKHQVPSFPTPPLLNFDIDHRAVLRLLNAPFFILYGSSIGLLFNLDNSMEARQAMRHMMSCMSVPIYTHLSNMIFVPYLPLRSYSQLAQGQTSRHQPRSISPILVIDDT